MTESFVELTCNWIDPRRPKATGFGVLPVVFVVEDGANSMNRAAMGELYNEQAKMQCWMDDKGEEMLTAEDLKQSCSLVLREVR